MKATIATARFSALMLLLGACAQAPAGIDPHKPNAWATDRAIIITSPLADLVDTRAELAFIVAHETGHIFLEHPYRSSGPMTQQMEIDADTLAFKMMRLADLNVCSGVSAMRKINAAVDNSSLKARLLHWSARFPWCNQVVEQRD